MPAAPRALVFDLDQTLVRSPLDLRAMAQDLLVFLRDRGVAPPARDSRWSAPELARFVREQAPNLEDGFWQIALAHEQRALLQSELEPGALESLQAVRALGFRTAVWTNNGGAVTQTVLDRLALAPHLDLIVTRQEVRHLKPDPDGLRVIDERWPDLRETFVVGDSWVDGQAAAAGGVPFIAYRADQEELKRRGVRVWAAIARLIDLPALFS
ncbi:MAG: HAD hydrolase-like protein [Candidatus Rokubacteria bacterium]|nr:HAD hydrolase-like protein [Candidatus Rokubacteria bacterium]